MAVSVGNRESADSTKAARLCLPKSLAHCPDGNDQSGQNAGVGKKCRPSPATGLTVTGQTSLSAGTEVDNNSKRCCR
ncbi:hypothetical protein R0381_000466 [Jeongeupia wiesaeckerbachi]|uniref:hypothetical protein n=1 Tax=Jeongeupia wiesaeckerbachi TaxID=3051218 RepID=UPI003D804382